MSTAEGLSRLVVRALGKGWNRLDDDWVGGMGMGMSYIQHREGSDRESTRDDDDSGVAALFRHHSLYVSRSGPIRVDVDLWHIDFVRTRDTRQGSPYLPPPLFPLTTLAPPFLDMNTVSITN